MVYSLNLINTLQNERENDTPKNIQELCQKRKTKGPARWLTRIPRTHQKVKGEHWLLKVILQPPYAHVTCGHVHTHTRHTLIYAIIKTKF